MPFPSTIPSSRTFTPGDYPNTPFAALTGKTTAVRHSSVMTASRLTLRYVDVTEAEMLAFLAHYNECKGGWTPFSLPTAAFSGADNPNDYTLPAYAWRYAEPPQVEDINCAGHIVELQLESVPGEGPGLLGIEAVIGWSLAAGRAAAANGVDLSVTWSIIYGAAFVPGFTGTIAASLSAGAATGAITGNALGVFGGPAWFLRPGLAVGNLGTLQLVQWSLASGVGYSSADANFADVDLLIQGITNITDASLDSRALTITGAAISTAQARFGPSSIAFDGTNDEITFGSITLSPPYCVDAWFYLNSTATAQALCFGLNQAVIYLNAQAGSGVYQAGGVVVAGQAGGGVGLHEVGAAGLVASRWYHLRFSNDATTERLFIDGSVISTKTTLPSGQSVSNGSFTITKVGASNGGNYLNGYVTGFRLTGGAARSTAAFNAPQDSWPDASGIRYAGPGGVSSTVTVTLAAGAASSP